MLHNIALNARIPPPNDMAVVVKWISEDLYNITSLSQAGPCPIAY